MSMDLKTMSGLLSSPCADRASMALQSKQRSLGTFMNTCDGCNYDISAHNAARKKAAEETKKVKIPALPVVLKAASREVAKLHKLGCSVSLMVQTPRTRKQATQWYFDSASTKGKASLDKHKGYFRKAMKNEVEGEVKVEEGAKSSEKVVDASEQKTVKPTGAGSANLFMLPANLEDLVKGFGDLYPETVIDTMLTALKKHYIDSKTAKASVDISALQSIFGKDLLGPSLRFLSSVKEL
ncbi:hypothetical protein KFL_008240070 [Klebsormidium nitens]|uniref:Uncharacterized protein n=1 Tax=Klebsormidium nitens TaxID=105231 RepID=A0A1Y1IL83_KLENI|nr:hypothetical protein KFL_008240070 [Klebsormidium nitens]|eukprot:GAQ91645.1 hypothetical protein KFL_008240070 [Klebsormidium nitens]